MQKSAGLRQDARSNTNASNDVLLAMRDTRYGGLNKRYAANRLKLIRTVDPFATISAEFRTPLHFDNWLLRTFMPGVVDCDSSFKGLQYIAAGKVRTVKADLMTTFVDGVSIVDLVVPISGDPNPPAWPELQAVATSFNIVPVLRLEAEIRRNPILLKNLDRWCQHRLCHNVLDVALKDEVYNSVPNHCEITAGDLLHELKVSWNSSVTFEALVNALISHYRANELHVNIAEATFGLDSTIRRIQ